MPLVSRHTQPGHTVHMNGEFRTHLVLARVLYKIYVSIMLCGIGCVSTAVLPSPARGLGWPLTLVFTLHGKLHIQSTV